MEQELPKTDLRDICETEEDQKGPSGIWKELFLHLKTIYAIFLWYRNWDPASPPQIPEKFREKYSDFLGKISDLQKNPEENHEKILKLEIEIL